MPYRNLKNGDDIEFHKKRDTSSSGLLGWTVATLLAMAALAGLAGVF
jgi:hypothetical protein